MMRCLDIGPGSQPIKNPKPEEVWETVDLYAGYQPTYLTDFRKMKGVPREFYNYIHASHVIEHCDWYNRQETIELWVSLLRPGGYIDIWTVDAIRCFDALYEWEATGTIGDGNVSTWRSKLTGGDPYLYWEGKLLNYFKAGANGDLNRHSGIITPNRLRFEMEKAGLKLLTKLDVDKDVRGHSHRMINMGWRGFKPES